MVKLSVIFPLDKNKSLWAGIILLVAGLFFGWYSGVPVLGDIQNFFKGKVGATAGGVITPTTCADSVSPEIRGTSSTLTFNAYNLEASDPYSSAVDTTVWVYKNGVGATNFVGSSTDTTAYDFSGFTVGDVAYVYGGGSSYYVEKLENVCVDAQRKNINLNAHAIQTQANMQITGYDDTGSTTLTTGTTGEENYEISLGANEQKTFYIQLKNNGADAEYDVCGIAVRVTNDVQDCYPVGYTSGHLAKYLDTTPITINQTGALNLTGGYDKVYTFDPIKLHEWESKKFQFVIKASTTDPTASDGASYANADLCIIQFVDCSYGRANDGTIYYDYYTHDESETNVGANEIVFNPYSLHTGVIIEAI
jgi:hypothetical protein